VALTTHPPPPSAEV